MQTSHTHNGTRTHRHDLTFINIYIYIRINNTLTALLVCGIKFRYVFFFRFHLLISIGANARRLVIFGAIIIGAIIKCSISFANGPSTTLVHKMPIEANKWPVLIAFMLQKTSALFDTKFFQITERNHMIFISNDW